MPDLDVNGSKSSLFFCVVHLDKELCSTLSLSSVHHYLEALGIYIIDSLFFCMPG